MLHVPEEEEVVAGKRPGNYTSLSIPELFLAIIAVGISLTALSNWCQESDESLFVRQAQLPEGPASALYDFEETYFTEPFIQTEQLSDNLIEPASCSIASSLEKEVSGPELIRINGVLKKGESLLGCLRRYNIGSKTRYRLLKALSRVINVHRCLPGERFTITRSLEGQVLALEWEKGPFKRYQVVLDKEGRYRVSMAPVTIENRLLKVSGRVTGGFYDSFADYGLSVKVARKFTEIFSTRIDFNSDIRVGDSFSIILNKYYKNGECIGTGRILAAKYCPLGGGCIEAYYFNDKKVSGRAGYFGPDGGAFANSFLRSPLKVYRVTSRFTSRRFHPILKVYRPHYGVDLAAPIGTPIMAVADGVVTFTGWQRGYGRIVVLKHSGGYKTYYGHLSRFAKGLKRGTKVQQKQIIGYVGRSGYATGPHLDYRVWHNGHFVDPFRMRTACAEKLGGKSLKGFIEKYKLFQALLRENVSAGIISVKKETINEKPNDFAS